MGLETKQMDYASAFVQVDIDTDVYLKMRTRYRISLEEGSIVIYQYFVKSSCKVTNM